MDEELTKAERRAKKKREQEEAWSNTSSRGKAFVYVAMAAMVIGIVALFISKSKDDRHTINELGTAVGVTEMQVVVQDPWPGDYDLAELVREAASEAGGAVLVTVVCDEDLYSDADPVANATHGLSGQQALYPRPGATCS